MNDNQGWTAPSRPEGRCIPHARGTFAKGSWAQPSQMGHMLHTIGSYWRPGLTVAAIHVSS